MMSCEIAEMAGKQAKSHIVSISASAHAWGDNVADRTNTKLLHDKLIGCGLSGADRLLC